MNTSLLLSTTALLLMTSCSGIRTAPKDSALISPERDISRSTNIQRLAVSAVNINPSTVCYSSPNKPDSHVEILVTGKTLLGDVQSFNLTFYPTGDSRLAPPFYDPKTKMVQSYQGLDSLPGWIANLTNLPAGQSSTITFGKSPFGEQWWVSSLRLFTSK